MAELSIISVKLVKNVVATYVNLTNRHFELARKDCEHVLCLLLSGLYHTCYCLLQKGQTCLLILTIRSKMLHSAPFLMNRVSDSFNNVEYQMSF